MVVLHARVPIKPEAHERWLRLSTPSRNRRVPRKPVAATASTRTSETPNSFIFVEEWG